MTLYSNIKDSITSLKNDANIKIGERGYPEDLDKTPPELNGVKLTADQANSLKHLFMAAADGRLKNDEINKAIYNSIASGGKKDDREAMCAVLNSILENSGTSSVSSETNQSQTAFEAYLKQKNPDLYERVIAACDGKIPGPNDPQALLQLQSKNPGLFVELAKEQNAFINTQSQNYQPPFQYGNQQQAFMAMQYAQYAAQQQANAGYNPYTQGGYGPNGNTGIAGGTPYAQGGYGQMPFNPAQYFNPGQIGSFFTNACMPQNPMAAQMFGLGMMAAAMLSLMEEIKRLGEELAKDDNVPSDVSSEDLIASNADSAQTSVQTGVVSQNDVVTSVSNVSSDNSTSNNVSGDVA